MQIVQPFTRATAATTFAATFAAVSIAAQPMACDLQQGSSTTMTADFRSQFERFEPSITNSSNRFLHRPTAMSETDRLFWRCSELVAIIRNCFVDASLTMEKNCDPETGEWRSFIDVATGIADADHLIAAENVFYKAVANVPAAAQRLREVTVCVS